MVNQFLKELEKSGIKSSEISNKSAYLKKIKTKGKIVLMS